MKCLAYKTAKVALAALLCASLGACGSLNLQPIGATDSGLGSYLSGSAFAPNQPSGPLAAGGTLLDSPTKNRAPNLTK
jgi:hypothetical protein